MSPKQIQRLRKRLNLTQAALAEHLGVTRAAVSLWESGDRTPRGPAVLVLIQLQSAANLMAKSS